MGVLAKLRRFRLPSLNRSDYASEERPGVENTDALAATWGRGIDPSGAGAVNSIPPNYVKQDDGRPPH